jgi:release factor glutamine methyltransferase
MTRAGAAGIAATSRSVRFGPLDIAYDERVLEPRAWTLHQSEWAAALLAGAPAGPVLELCSGAGQIGLAAAVLADRDAVLVDASEVACEFARDNAAAAGWAGRTDVRHEPMTEALSARERFALVLADPPYIPSAGTSTYPEDPLSAIDGGDDGLDLARTCLGVAARHLEPGRPLLLQLRDEEQAARLATEASDAGALAPVEARTFEDRGTVLHLTRTGHAAATPPVVC